MTTLEVKEMGTETEVVDEVEQVLSADQTKEELMSRIAATGKTTYLHLLFFNSLKTSDSAKEGIETFIDIHSNLMTLHGFMAGFQYVALENGTSENPNTLEKTIFTLRVLGFGMSLLGTMISLITIEFLKSIQEETPEFQVVGGLKYFRFFLWSDKLAVLAGVTLATTVNLVVHDNGLPEALPYAINAVSVVLAFAFFYMFKTMIVDRQEMKPGRHYYQYLDKHSRKSA